jgi:hypothetical protein
MEASMVQQPLRIDFLAAATPLTHLFGPSFHEGPNEKRSQRFTTCAAW